ncbi:flavodoxin FldB [Thalassomonas viridans]|uniref:Flavodoxin n=1 Tax=Thalassomonas viridans TaxID=137584 RepID=A0AAE9Z414_9GAMM|nr:flavodoxin FldB [Thalassomonas viridans]WDE06351.1 flavodoxin FldB [Thalassomonas viridans]
MKIGLFYGSTTCYTEMAAEKIQSVIGESLVELHNIKDVPLSRCLDYDFLIFGISTWDYGELQEDWESHWEEAAGLALSDKVIALYGMGDQIGYSEWFQDALGMLHDIIVPSGATIIGYWPNQGYEFAASKALTQDNSHFVGLSIDDENQYKLTDERIASWCQQILEEFADL